MLMNFLEIKSGIIKRASLYVALAALITFAILLAYNYYISKKIILDNIRDNTRALAVSTLSQINTVLVAAEKMPENVSCILEYVDFTDEEFNNSFTNILKLNEGIFGTAIAYEPYMYNSKVELFCPYFYRTSKGKIECRNLVDAQYDYLDQEWYKTAKDLNKGFWSEPYFDEGGGNIMMVTFSQPFYKNVNGKRIFSGVITCDISLQWLTTMVSKIKIFDTGYAFVLSPKGTFIAHPNEKYYINHESFFTLADKFNDKKERELGEKMLQGETGYEKYFSHNRKKTCYLYYQPIAVTGCTLGIVIPEDELLFKLRALTFTLFLIGAIGNLPSIIIKLATKNIYHPIKSAYRKISGKFK